MKKDIYDKHSVEDYASAITLESPEEEIRENSPEELSLFKRTTVDTKESEHLSVQPYSYWKAVARLFFHNPVAIFSICLLAFLILGAIFIPMFAPADAFTSNTDLIEHPIRFSSTYWFGSDFVGRNLFFCCWLGLRKSLVLSFICTAIVTTLGVIFGLIWGYVKWLDKFFIEIYNFTMNIPSLLLWMLLGFVLTAVTRYDEEGKMVFQISQEVRLCISLTLFDWLGTARFIRNQILIINDREYNIASMTLNTPAHRVMTKNLLPYLMAVIATNASLTIPSMISGEVVLSYFGLGLDSTTISIGSQIQGGIAGFGVYSWQLLWPAFILGLVVMAFFLLGISLSDSMDPKKHR